MRRLFADYGATGRWAGSFQAHTSLSEAPALALQRLQTLAQSGVLRRHDAVGGCFPTVEHRTGQAGAFSEVFTPEASQGAAGTKQVSSDSRCHPYVFIEAATKFNMTNIRVTFPKI